MKVLIVAKANLKFVLDRLVSETKKAGHDVLVIRYEDLSFEFSKQLAIKTNGEQIDSDYDAIMLRMAPGGVMVYYKDVLASYFSRSSFVVNGKTFIKWPFFGKITQTFLLAQAGLPVIESKMYTSKKLFKAGIADHDYPLVIKKHFGRLGNSVFKADNEAEVEKIVDSGYHKYIIQKYLPTRQDYRVIVIGGKALPLVMKKTAPEGQFVTNVSQGGKAESEEITEELRELSERATELFSVDFAGVDIMYDDKGKPYILEVNRSPNFKGFEGSTGINVVGELIKFIETRING